MSSSSATASLFGVPLKAISLCALILQNSVLAILLHYSRLYSAPYSAGTAVLLNELLKGSVSLTVALHRVPKRSRLLTTTSPKRKFGEDGLPARPAVDWRELVTDVSDRSNRLAREVLSPDCWKLSVPAVLYVIQNNLQFVAASNLDVATFQVSYQLKILTTALCSIIMLKRTLSSTKWLALVLLAAGVGIVQLAPSAGKPRQHAVTTHDMDPVKGFAAVAFACFTSGLAGVYFEMVLKGSTTDLWIRNLQLSLFSLVPAVLPILFPNFGSSDMIDDNEFAGMFDGFGFWAWATVLAQVFGGLITALVIRYSDNILKGFATSISIILSFLAGVWLFNFQISTMFLLGTGLVLSATALYNRTTPAQRLTATQGRGQPHSISLNTQAIDREKDRLRSNSASSLHLNMAGVAGPSLDGRDRADLTSTGSSASKAFYSGSPDMGSAASSNISLRRHHDTTLTPPNITPTSSVFNVAGFAVPADLASIAAATPPNGRPTSPRVNGHASGLAVGGASSPFASPKPHLHAHEAYQQHTSDDPFVVHTVSPTKKLHGGPVVNAQSPIDSDEVV